MEYGARWLGQDWSMTMVWGHSSHESSLQSLRPHIWQVQERVVLMSRTSRQVILVATGLF